MKYKYINKVTQDVIEVEAQDLKEAYASMKKQAALKISPHNRETKNWQRQTVYEEDCATAKNIFRS